MSDTAIVIGVGAEQGIGAATCRRFGREGLHILVGGRTPEKIDQVAASVVDSGGQATPVRIDATNEADVIRLFDEAERLGGAPPKAVVFNAGNNFFHSLVDTDASVFEDIWRVTCFAGFLAGREAARRMPPAGGGTLIFTGATSAVKGQPRSPGFASAKAGLRLFAQAMAREFGPQGLHVAFSIIDGAVHGERLLSRLPEYLEQLGEDGSLNVDAVADTYWHLHTQHRSAWTHEIDLRPFKEVW